MKRVLFFWISCLGMVWAGIGMPSTPPPEVVLVEPPSTPFFNPLKYLWLFALLGGLRYWFLRHGKKFHFLYGILAMLFFWGVVFLIVAFAVGWITL